MANRKAWETWEQHIKWFDALVLEKSDSVEDGEIYRSVMAWTVIKHSYGERTGGGG
jgi:hypothetical protein